MSCVCYKERTDTVAASPSPPHCATGGSLLQFPTGHSDAGASSSPWSSRDPLVSLIVDFTFPKLTFVHFITKSVLLLNTLKPLLLVAFRLLLLCLLLALLFLFLALLLLLLLQINHVIHLYRFLILWRVQIEVLNVIVRLLSIMINIHSKPSALFSGRSESLQYCTYL